MRNPQNVLINLTKHSNSKDYKYERLYRLLYNEEMGGKPRKENKHNKDDDENPPKVHNKHGRGTNKTPVVGMIDRNNKKIFAKVAMPNEEGKKLTANQLMDLLEICHYYFFGQGHITFYLK